MLTPESQGSCSGKQTSAFTLLFSIWIALLGIWDAFAEEALPLWASIICHIADIFCHGIILSSLVGIVVDFWVAVRNGHLLHTVSMFFLCFDTIESHGVTGEIEKFSVGSIAEVTDEEDSTDLFGHTEILQHQQRRLPKLGIIPQLVRASFIWLLVLMALWAAVSSSYFPDETPSWVATATRLEGCLCWAGIARWLTESMLKCKYRFINSGPHTSLSLLGSSAPCCY